MQKEGGVALSEKALCGKGAWDGPTLFHCARQSD